MADEEALSPRDEAGRGREEHIVVQVVGGPLLEVLLRYESAPRLAEPEH